MISAHSIASSGAAANYHQEAWQVKGSDEYYIKDHVPNTWGGAGAEHAGFGIGQQVDKADFIKALDGELRNGDGSESKLGRWGKNEETGEQEWQHRAGMDFTFAPPKSVSMVGLIGQDERIRAVHEAAVEKAMAYLEREGAMARATINGQTEQIKTGNLLYAKFQHETARPVDGRIDTQIHTHVVIANATFDKNSNAPDRSPGSKLVAHGVAPFEHKEDNKASYYVQLEGRDGKISEIWGVGLERAVSDSGAKIGDVVNVARLGSEKVTVQDKAGNWITAERNAWQVDIKGQGGAAVEPAGVWRSLSNEQLLALRTTADRIYQGETARGLQSVGFKLDHDAKSFEMRGVSRDQLELFSGRQNEIHAHLSAQGLDPKTASFQAQEAATQATRAHKDDFERGAVQNQWEERARSVGLDIKQIVAESRAIESMARDRQAAAEIGAGRVALDKAIGHLAEREAVFDRPALIRETMGFARGLVGIDHLERSIEQAKADGRLVEREGVHQERYTTPAAIAQEKQMLRTMIVERQSVTPALDRGRIDPRLEALDRDRGFALNAGQRDSARMILTTGDRFTAVTGSAGTGKTTLFEAVNKIATERGITVVGMSSGAKQAGILQADSGIKSQTVASFLGQCRSGSQDLPVGRQIWVVDEASMLNQKDATELMRYAVERDAQVVFSGDPQQHQSPAAGKPFEQMLHAGITKTALTEVNRQKDDIGRAAVREIHANFSKSQAGDSLKVTGIAKGRDKQIDGVYLKNERTGASHFVNAAHGHGIKLRERMTVREASATAMQVERGNGQTLSFTGGIHAAYDRLEKVVVADPKALVDRLAHDYARATDRQSTVVVTATNASRMAINAAVRVELRQDGTLKGSDQVRETLRDRRLTEIEAKEAGRYQVGDMLRAERAYRTDGIGKGDYLRVEKLNADRNQLVCRTSTGREVTINPSQRTQFHAYAAQRTALASGDQVRFGLNDKSLGVRNGESGIVQKIEGNKLTVAVGDKGKTVDINTDRYKHVDHVYSRTSFDAQGLSEKTTSYHIDANQAGGVGERSAYVGLTRAKEGTTVYTTDNDKARELVGRAQEKTAALDLNRDQKQYDQAKGQEQKPEPKAERQLDAPVKAQEPKQEQRQETKQPDRAEQQRDQAKPEQKPEPKALEQKPEPKAERQQDAPAKAQEPKQEQRQETKQPEPSAERQQDTKGQDQKSEGKSSTEIKEGRGVQSQAKSSTAIKTGRDGKDAGKATAGSPSKGGKSVSTGAGGKTESVSPSSPSKGSGGMSGGGGGMGGGSGGGGGR